MFSDAFQLTQAVLEGRKTQTRRIVPRSFFTCTHDILDNNTLVCEDMYGDWHDIRKTRYALQVGEVVAVAQSYKDAGNFPDVELDEDSYPIMPKISGYFNKMFVRADLMPHRIRITDVRVERLNDISESDIKAEGIDYIYGYSENYFFGFGVKTGKRWLWLGNSPREAYAALIDKISGKGTFESNPYVFAYTFELVK